jgi:adenylosuccinate lyase
VVKNLIVYPENMKKNLDKLGGLHKSQNILLALTHKGISRQKAYEIVQSSAMKSWNSNDGFEEILLNNEEIKKYLTKDELRKIFVCEDNIVNIDWIFQNKI